MMYAILVIGFILLLAGAEFLIRGASDFAKNFRAPGIISGMLIGAIGMSTSKFAVSFTAAIQEKSQLVFGNIIGAALFNLLVVCGICAMVQTIKLSKRFIQKEFPFFIFATIFALYMSADYLLHGKNTVRILSRRDGILLIVLFVYFLWVTMKMGFVSDQKKYKGKGTVEEKEPIPLWKCSAFFVMGIAAILCGGYLTVQGAMDITEQFALSQNMIGMIVVAIGSSLPEFVNLLREVKKNGLELGAAVENVIVSNIVTILLVLGISAMIHPIPLIMNNIYDLIFLCLTSILVWLFTCRKIAIYSTGEINRLQGCAMVTLYVAYMVFVCVR